MITTGLYYLFFLFVSVYKRVYAPCRKFRRPRKSEVENKNLPFGIHKL